MCEPDGAVLLVLGTASDDRMSQLRAGEATVLAAIDREIADEPGSDDSSLDEGEEQLGQDREHGD